jgi:hypothetical protein
MNGGLEVGGLNYEKIKEARRILSEQRNRDTELHLSGKEGLLAVLSEQKELWRHLIGEEEE